jgi:hypothetical protein
MAQYFELSRKPKEMGDWFSNYIFLGDDRDEPKWKKRRVFKVATSNELPYGEIFRSQIYAPHSTTLPTSSQSFLIINLPDRHPHTVIPAPSSLTAESTTVMKSSRPISSMTVT